MDENTQTEILSPNDTKFGSISLLYRLPIREGVFVESRAGYASLSYFVHTDTEDKVKRPNFTYGIGLGATVYNNCTISLRYQHLGSTAVYEGMRESTTIKLSAEPVDVVLLRIAYRFKLLGR